MSRAPLYVVELATVGALAGPLLFVDRATGVAVGEVVEIVAPDGSARRGQVLEIDGERAVVEVFAGTRGLDLASTIVRLSGEPARLGVGVDLLGRILDGSGRAVDGGPPPMPESFSDVHGAPINPAARLHPTEFIETGVSAIDGLNTLLRGQKLPIFSGFGLPSDELAARIATDARVPGDDEGFAVVFAAMGITHRQAAFYRQRFSESGRMHRSVVFLNLADDAGIERLLTPRLALTAAEYLAFERGMHVLVILTDMTNYCEALREVATAREEVPGRRGYPGYMYTDLASLYERAGRLRGREGSVTQLVIVSMPDDDITHPIPDLSGYITEGQIVLSRDLHRKGVDPPIDVLPSLSRLMNAGIGDGRTRSDHRQVADQLYAAYARGRDLRRMVAIIGEAGLGDVERSYLEFADLFEDSFVSHDARRGIDETLDAAWDLFDLLPAGELKKLSPELVVAHRGGEPDTAPVHDPAESPDEQ